MKTLNKLILLPILALTSGYVAAETMEATDIKNFNNVWVTNFDQGNTEELTGLYTENAIIFPPTREILQGRKAIQFFLQGLKETGLKEYSISNIDVNKDVKESTVYESAAWEAKLVDKEGKVIKLEGNISNVYEKQSDGSWKIKFQSWN